MELMWHLETLIRQTAADRNISKVKVWLEKTPQKHLPNDYKRVAGESNKKQRVLFDNWILVPKTLRQTELNPLHFGQSQNVEICQDARTIWWQVKRKETETQAQRYTACIRGGRNLWPHYLNIKKTHYQYRTFRERNITGIHWKKATRINFKKVPYVSFSVD